MPRTKPPRKDKNRVPRVKQTLPAAPQKDAERIAKVIARAGLGSRREIEDWIAAGRVAVNGQVLESPAFTVTAEDKILVDGAPLPERERTRLYLYHKPRGVVTTNRDPEGRTTLFEILPKGLPRLVSVGRLDLNSEGLLLLTNDGGLARALELPETGWLRRYRVRAKGDTDQAKLDALLGGIIVEGVEYGAIEAVLDRVQGSNAWLTVGLREGKNREVRKVLGALGLQVNRLIRVSYGPFQLGDLPEGQIEEVRTRILRDQIGAELTAASGADFDGPVVEREVEAAAARPSHAAEESQPARPSRPWPRGSEPEPEQRGRARNPRGGGEDPSAFRLDSRRGTAERAKGAQSKGEHSNGPRGKSERAKPERTLESRGTVADRKGREIKVERVVKVMPAEPPRGRGARGQGPHAKGAHGAGVREERRSGPGRSPSRGAYGEDRAPRAHGPRSPERADRFGGEERAGRFQAQRERPGSGERPTGRQQDDRRGPTRGREARGGEDVGFMPRPARGEGPRPSKSHPYGTGGGEERPRGRPYGTTGGEDRPKGRPYGAPGGGAKRGANAKGGFEKGGFDSPGRPGGGKRPGPGGPRGAGAKGGPFKGGGPKGDGPRSGGPKGAGPKGGGPRGASPRGAGPKGAGPKGAAPKSGGRPPRGVR